MRRVRRKRQTEVSVYFVEEFGRSYVRLSKLVAGFDVVHKKMPLEETQKSFQKLAQLIEIDAKQATTEYQDFLAQSEHEGLICTIDKTSWLVDRPTKYMNLRLVFIVSLTVPISNAEVER